MAPKKSKFLRNLLIICVPLILVQGVILFRYKSKNKPVSFQEAMDSAVSGEGVDPTQQEIIKIQLALSDYHIKSGSYPENLEDLVPDYFESVPIDPNTAEPFKYTAKDGTFFLGQEGVTEGGTSQGGDDKGDAPEVVETVDEQEALIESLDTSDGASYIYDSSNKRDPFRSYDFTKQSADDKDVPPLQKFDYASIKLTAVLLGTGEPKAIMEDGTGRGHTVKIGTEVGLYGGKVVKIEKDKVVVLEVTVDFTGQTNKRAIDFFLPKEEKDFGSLSRNKSIGKKRPTTKKRKIHRN